MPGPYENLMYSWNLGPIHFISLNTEAYYFLEYGVKLMILQYEWLQKDLAVSVILIYDFHISVVDKIHRR